MKSLNQRLRQSGASLIEVLVALLVISIGLLGIAKTQAVSLGNTKTASSRSIASIHAASMASAMNANKFYWGGGLAPTSVSVTGSITNPNSTAISDATLNSQNADCVTTICDPAQIAAYDLRYWGSYLAQQLPSGVGTVACTTTVGVVTCSIQVQWAETYISLSESSRGTQQAATQTLTLLVQP